jgi:hypothetical protein
MVSLEKIKSEPYEWTIEPVIVLDWDGNYPVERWADTLQLNKIDTTINNVPFILREITVIEGDSTKKMYIIESNVNETYSLIK